jgi:hypothetical protein
MPASGHQDHTSSPSASGALVRRTLASTASRPAFVTLRNAPLCGTGWPDIWTDLLFRKTRIFFPKGLDKALHGGRSDLPVGLLCAGFGPQGQSAGQRFIASFGNILPGTEPDGAWPTS